METAEEKKIIESIGILLDKKLDDHWAMIQETRVDTDTKIKETIVLTVNGKIDNIKKEILEMRQDDESRGSAITYIGKAQKEHNEKLEQLIIRLEPVAQAFEKNKLFSAMLVSKIKFLAMIAGSILALFAGWELIIKSLIKPFIK